jgi:putative transposase
LLKLDYVSFFFVVGEKMIQFAGMKPKNADVIREEKGKRIASKKDAVKRLNDTKYRVRSQSGNGMYYVENTEIGWKCDCPDHKFRGMKCKHIWAVEISFKMREQAKPKRILEPITITNCPICDSDHLRKDGIRHNKSGDLQKYKCLDCGKCFSVNVGFEKMKHNPQAITTAMQLYFSGESLRNTQKSLKFIGVDVSHMTVNRWIEKYVGIMKAYVDNIKPDVSQTWRADEVWIKVKGDLKYLFALMDDETRYWIAQEVADTKYIHDARAIFHEAKVVADKRPETLITDGLPAYRRAFNDEFFTKKSPRSQHINAIKLTGHGNNANNNKMERINGEIRDREKTMRGLKIKETSILQGMQIYHNFIRPHEGLDGRTPAEACGIELKGDNKWITLIQNASISAKTN